MHKRKKCFDRSWMCSTLDEQVTPIYNTKYLVEIYYKIYFGNDHQSAAWPKEVSNTVKSQLPTETK